MSNVWYNIYSLCKYIILKSDRGIIMEKQLKLFFEFLENDKKLSDNTLQSYKRDIKQFKEYLNQKGKDYSNITKEDMKEYIEQKSWARTNRPNTISKNRKKSTKCTNIKRGCIIIRTTKRCWFKRNKR